MRFLKNSVTNSDENILNDDFKKKMLSIYAILDKAAFVFHLQCTTLPKYSSDLGYM